MQGKNGINKQKSGYIKLPTRLFEIALSLEAMALYVYLIKNTEDYNPSVGSLHNVLKISKKSIRKYLKELLDHGIIEKSGFKRFQLYRLVNPREWK